MKISVIIPTYNEENIIRERIKSVLTKSSQNNIAEIVIVDGGSTDSTEDIVKTTSAIFISSNEKGRAVQMNEGAKVAVGDILYFLHADSDPPVHFDRLIIGNIRKGNESGCFRMKFDLPHILLNVSAWFTRFNFIICRGGDQSLYTSKRIFEKAGGFNTELAVMEDIEIIKRIKKNSRFTIIPHTLTTSARKYAENGVWYLQFRFAMIHLKYNLGATQQQLTRYYKKHIV